MIRDPSDGSVREKAVEGKFPVTDPMPAPVPGMPTIFDEISAAIAAGKVKPERVSEKWEYQRAWNDGIDFALRQIKNIAAEDGRGK